MKIQLEQTLHGYYKGHGLIATSISNLNQEDASLMATLSDWTGYRGSEDEDDNYLTIYPLSSGNYMAFAKTWYAKEMERPGCVWTHTLLVPIECFTGKFDIRNLLKFFRRPVKDQYAMYTEALIIDTEEVYNYNGDSIFSKIDKIAFLFIFSVFLGGFRGASFGINRSQNELQILLLSLLQYLPLNILLETSVSSGSETIRKINKKSFSLQFIMGGNTETLESGNWRSELEEDNFTRGLQYLYEVACKMHDNTSYLIHLFDKDIEKSIIKFESVINLFKLLDYAVDKNKKTPPYSDVLAYIFGAFPKGDEGKIVKSNFLSKKITDYFCTDSECLKEISLRNIDEEDWKFVDVEQRLPHLNTSDLLILSSNLISHDSISKTPSKILLYAFEYLDAAQISAIVEMKWDLLKHLIIGNDSYITKEYWLWLSPKHFCEYFHTLPIELAQRLRQWDMLLLSVLRYEAQIGSAWANEIFKHVDSVVNIVFDYINKEERLCVDESLLKGCLLKTNDCLDWMTAQTDGVKNEFLLDALTSYINPSWKQVREYPNSYWKCLINSNSKRPSFLSFTFMLAFQLSGSYSLCFLKKSFDEIYMLLSNSAFPDSDWNRILVYEYKFKFIRQWDKCQRLCLMVIFHLYKNGFKKDVIKSISDDKKIRERLLKYWKKIDDNK